MGANIGNSKAVYFQCLIEKSITWRTIRLNQCHRVMISSHLVFPGILVPIMLQKTSNYVVSAYARQTTTVNNNALIFSPY